MDNKTKILLAEGDRDLAAAVETTLKRLGYDVTYTYDGVLAITAFTEKKYDLMILGGDVSRISAAEVAELFSVKCGAPVLLLIKNRIKNVDPLNENFGFAAFLTLPFTAEELEAEVSRAINSQKQEDLTVGGVTLSFKAAKLRFGENAQNVSLAEAELLKQAAKGEEAVGDSLDCFKAMTAVNKKLALLGAKLYIKKTTKGYEVAYD